METEQECCRQFTPSLLNVGISCYNRGDYVGALTHFKRALRSKSPPAQAFIYLALSNHSLGRIQNAIKILHEATNKHPTYFAAHATLGKFLAEQKRFVEAQKTLQNAIHLQPKSITTRMELAKVYTQLGKLRKAETAFLKVIALDPTYFQAYFGLGVLFREKKHFRHAEQALQRAIKLHPPSVNARAELGELYFQMGEPEKAARILKETLYQRQAYAAINYAHKNRLKKTEASLHGLANAGPAYAKLIDGEHLFRQQRFKEAEAVFRAALELADDPHPILIQLGSLYLRVGELKREKGFFQKARHHLDPVLKKHPTNLEALCCRFKVLLLLGEFQSAFQDAEKILDLDHSLNSIWDSIIPWNRRDGAPTNRLAFQRLLHHLNLIGDKTPHKIWVHFYRMILYDLLAAPPAWQDAAKHVEKLMMNRYRWMHAFIGQFHLFRGEWQKAISHFQTALPSFPKIWKIHCLLGEAKLGLGNPVEAMMEFDKAVVASEGHNDALAWRGEINLWLGNYQAAMNNLEASVRLKSTLAFCWLGGVLVKLKKYRKALKNLDLAIYYDPFDAEAYTWRAEAKCHLRQCEAALEDINKAIRLSRGIWAYFNRALIYAKLGHFNKLRKDFYFIKRKFSKPTCFIADKRNRPVSSVSTNRDIIDFLESGLHCSRGNRRDEEFATWIWMATYS